jgi:hypothetical protein
VAFTVAIMQPYFLPYAGYFRLLAQADLFVIYDCVQFPRRGWLHRNKLIDRQGEERWLTLPLQPAPQEVLIRDLAFADNADTEMAERLRPFDLETPYAPAISPILKRLREPTGRPVDYIVELLRQVCGHLDLPWNVVTSSSLDVSAEVRGQDRILALAKTLGAERYLNAPGGRDLYDEASFAAGGIGLAFLAPFEGKGGSILQRLLHEPPEQIRRDIAP